MKDLTISSADLDKTAEDGPRRRGNRTTRVPAIIEAAIEVFASEGNAGFTQRRIASDAGIRLRTLQHYFSTREELLRATIEAFTSRYFEHYRTIAEDKRRPPEARLEVIVDEAFSVLTAAGGKRVSAFVLESWSLAEHESALHALMAKTTADFQALLAELIAQINPTLAARECTLRGALLLSHLQGLVVYLRRADTNTLDADSFRHAMKVVWRALSKASP
ncbi:DNA-binding transcriptional regulator YbjK [Paraburkholderia atlantica]|uniref:DNA-binding transcriptional regulator YbjK n=1 Tax=Paraburkholderia atlantica TaxID=2654982 RepID=A0A7W8Q4D5_PARAM|nr:TetR/AcrR family transcriptional regulator [Paraburkholderia atlantica]MBB5414702.1 DNA-binding transcriptional regulator YbjK [Paraburkholderia atlantica]MBB5423514.1 DNA-binding transcriptional regulator YbjK [Paraburkholderia atlantica]NUY29209.1 TetR/AcrR family transcriptional regulator [Paraburkholderia atlantica]